LEAKTCIHSSAVEKTAAMEVFLVLNGFEIQCSVDEQERIVLQVASGGIDREALTQWLRDHVVAIS
jgi:death on curing protein